MKKAAIICASDLSRMTMASIYTEYFETYNIPYDIIYVDKYKDSSPFHAQNYYAFNVEGYEEANFIKKLGHYWKMRDFVKEKIQTNNYDFLVVWGELAVFLFSDILAREMPKKYCINIRDYFYNRVFFVWHRLKEAIQDARFFTVSSDAYLRYLPDGESLTMHSLNRQFLETLSPVEQYRSKDEVIRILYIGLIARLPYAYKMIDELSNDSRYELIFAGIGSEMIDKYIEGKNINNVKTYGKFPASDTAKYLENADILYNLYGYNNKHFDTALSIKLYYAIALNIPIMVFDGTYTKEVADRCGIGYVLHEDDYRNLGDRLFEWYHSRNLNDIRAKCEEYLQKVDKSHDELKKHLDDVFACEEG